MKPSPLSRSCPVCENPASICPCPTDGGEALALDLLRKAEDFSNGKVMILREDFLVLCERAFAWGQQQSAEAIGLRSEIEPRVDKSSTAPSLEEFRRSLDEEHAWIPDGGALRFESHQGGEAPHLHTTCKKCGERTWFTERQWALLSKGCGT
jgi:hypothetical protein